MEQTGGKSGKMGQGVPPAWVKNNSNDREAKLVQKKLNKHIYTPRQVEDPSHINNILQAPGNNNKQETTNSIQKKKEELEKN